MEPARPSPKIRVLLVDDHQVVAAALATLLGAEPDMEVAGTAASIDDLQDHHNVDYDCVLINYLLRDGNAAVATRLIKRRMPHARVVVISRSRDTYAERRVAQAGADAFIGGDASSGDLLSALRGTNGAAGSGEVPGAQPTPRRHRASARAGADRESLTPRERDVLRALVLGRTTRQMCDEFGIGQNTVRTHVQNIIAKLHVHSRLEAVALASRERLV